MCYANNPLSNLSKIYSYVDLRKQNLVTAAKDQSQCGGCWAFGTVAVLETSLLRNSSSFSQLWKNFTVSTLNVSEQFVLSNAFGANSYCDGGDFTTAVDAIMQNFSTVETAAHFPYNYSKYQSTWDKKKTVAPVLNASDYAKPFNLYANYYNSKQSTPVVALNPSQK